MRYAFAIFDPDGTLADNFPWFLRTINDVADRSGFRRVAPDDARDCGMLEATSARAVPTC
jgi:phosphoglycolate phosphatase